MMTDHETKIIIAGFGGQGVVVAGNIIARACVIEGKNVAGMISYGAEMRGGTANATVVISDREIASPFVERPDIAIIMNQPSLDKFEEMIVSRGLAVLNTSLVDRDVQRQDLEVAEIEASRVAHRLGNVRVANMVAVGAFAARTSLLEMSSLARGIEDLFSSKKANMVDINIEALQQGAQMMLSK